VHDLLTSGAPKLRLWLKLETGGAGKGFSVYLTRPVRTNRSAKLSGSNAMASLEQSIEMRNVPKADLERNFGNRSPLLLVDQTLRAKSDPPVI
jgi:hypothetical protein